MRFEDNLLKGKFLSRVTRFSAKVLYDGKEVLAYIPNSGRLKELLKKDNAVLLQKVDSSNRKTGFDFIGVKYNNIWVSIDARLPNLLFREAIENGILHEFSGYSIDTIEAKLGQSRIDFILKNKNGDKFWVEVKSCTLVENGIAKFPDAPTLRGIRHIEELMKVKTKGIRSAVVFIVQREDAEVFSPNYEADKKFGEVLNYAYKNGVEVYAYLCKFDGKEIKIIRNISIKFKY